MKLDATEKPKYAGEDIRGTHLHLNKLRQQSLMGKAAATLSTSEQKGSVLFPSSH